MAERRMFAKAVIGSARFLRMPPTSRLLYYDLGMEADDDGCVEAFGVMRKTGAAEDDLRVLASRGFVRVLNDDLVSYILDWGKNNQIRKDRYHAGIYRDLIGAACNVCIEGDSQMTTTCQPNDNQMAPESSLGKSSPGKEERADKPPSRSRFVPPTFEEVNAYCLERGNKVDPQCFVDFYEANGWVQGKGKPIKDWKAAVRTWERREPQSGRGTAETGRLTQVVSEDGETLWRRN